MTVTCPHCDYDFEIEGEVLPECACDDVEIECHNPACEKTFKIGWVAEIEYR